MISLELQVFPQCYAAVVDKIPTMANLSGIDVIIFKLVISEGWDIPRACMLYQARNSRSKQLDEQVIGRVRRNPRLLDFETLSDKAKSLATTAWVWGVSKNDTELKKCYKQASIVTGHIFYLPIMKEDVWRITKYQNGIEETLTIDQFRNFVLNK